MIFYHSRKEGGGHSARVWFPEATLGASRKSIIPPYSTIADSTVLKAYCTVRLYGTVDFSQVRRIYKPDMNGFTWLLLGAHAHSQVIISMSVHAHELTWEARGEGAGLRGPDRPPLGCTSMTLMPCCALEIPCRSILCSRSPCRPGTPRGSCKCGPPFPPFPWACSCRQARHGGREGKRVGMLA
jgi:hypothetical protein